MSTTTSEQSALERTLFSMTYRAADLAVLESVDDVLAAVVRGAREMFASDVAYFTMHDEDTDEFYVRKTEGFLSEAFATDRSTVRGFGIYGFIIDHQRPFWTPDYQQDHRFQPHQMNTNSIRAEGIGGLAGAPAPLPGRAIPGVVFVGFRSVREFTDEEIALLVAWGKVGGAAVENALRREATAADLARTSSSASVLQAEVEGLRHVADVQDRLAAVTTAGGTLDDLVATLADLLDASVAVRAEDGTPLAASTDVGDATVGSLDAAVAQSFSERRAVRRGEVVVAAVRGQTQFLGAVTAHFADEPPRQAVQTVELGAIHVAGLLMARERLAAASNRAMADIVIGLLRQPQDDVESLETHAARQGVRLRGRTRLLVVDVDGLAAGRALERARQELAQEPALLGFYNGTLVMLHDGDLPPDLPDRLLRALSLEGVRPTVLVGDEALATSRLPDAFANGQRCLRLAVALGRRGEACPQGELAPYSAVFGRLSPEELEAYLRSHIGPLVAQDAAKGTDLTTTLRTYLTAGENVAATAELLYLHPNTVRQRMATITRVLPVLADPERRLDVHLALRLHALRGTSA